MQEEAKMYLFNIVKGKWRLLIIEDLFTGSKQFVEMQDDIQGISAKGLSSNLQYLMECGIVNKDTCRAVFPPRTTYTLSDRGMKLRPIINDIYDWGIENYTPTVGKSTDEFYRIFQ